MKRKKQKNSTQGAKRQNVEKLTGFLGTKDKKRTVCSPRCNSNNNFNNNNNNKNNNIKKTTFLFVSFFVK